MEKIKQHLYRHFDEWGNLLYVGVSLSTIQRLSQHKHQSHWFNSIHTITIQQFSSREEVLEAERIAIQKEEPQHNLNLNLFKNGTPPIITKDKREDSRVNLTNHIVEFKPMYSFEDAAHVFGVGTSKIKEWCEVGKLGYVVISKRWNAQYNKWSLKKRITGWQILDYIENLEIKRHLTEKGKKKEYIYLSDVLKSG